MSQHTARLPYHQLSPKAFMGLVNLSETIKKGPLGTRLAELATGLGTLEPHPGHTPAAGQWAALEQRLHAGSQAAAPALAEDWRTLNQHWQNWRTMPADDLAGQTAAHQRTVEALAQLAQRTHTHIQREQHSQDSRRQ